MARGEEAYSGLANLANSVRRSTALYVAMSITPPESSVDDLLATADRLAEWVRGSAGAEESKGPSDGGPPLGVPWDGRDEA